VALSYDVWIGAAAASAGATVTTYDGHFADIQRVGSVVLPTPSKT
jgi:predicted nucleic acid-binding protein